MTFYIKRPGQDEGEPLGTPPDRWELVGSLDAMGDEWSLHLPHQCGAWEIAYGTRAETLAEARQFRDELDRAIAVLEQAEADHG